MTYRLLTLVFFVVLLSKACTSVLQAQSDTLKKPTLHWIGEYVVPFDATFDNMTVGGLSEIDYDEKNDTWYLLSDDLYDENGRLRFYTAELRYTDSTFDTVYMKTMQTIKQPDGSLYPTKKEGLKTADPESMRLHATRNTLFWCSEGDRKRNILPSIAEMDIKGYQINQFMLPAHVVDTTQGRGWYHNAAIEAIAFSSQQNKLWYITENSLQQDGEEAKTPNGTYPIRLTLYDYQKQQAEKEFVYLMEGVAKIPNPPTGFGVNGIVSILEWKKNQVLILERSYSSGLGAGTNVVRLFLVDTSQAQDVHHVSSLNNQVYVPLKKHLVADLAELGVEFIDNIEGMTFGKRLPNGNKTLVLVSDNNFQAIQRTQFLAFEVVE